MNNNNSANISAGSQEINRIIGEALGRNAESQTKEDANFGWGQTASPSFTTNGQSKRFLSSILLSEAKPEALEPLWPDVLYSGKVTLVGGNPGEGKTAIACFIAATVSTGGDWPCGGGKVSQGHVLYLTVEDAAGDTLRPRIDVCGGDPTRIEHILGTCSVDAKSGLRSVKIFSLIEELELLEKKIRETNAKLLVIDPISSFADRNLNKSEEVRPLMDALSGLAQRTKVAVLVICHLNKRTDISSAIHQFSGSHSLVGAVRIAYLVQKDSDNPQRRLLLPAKTNMTRGAEGFAFAIETATHQKCGDTAFVRWEEKRIEMTADEAIHEAKQASKNGNFTHEVVWLGDLLASGPLPAKDVIEEGKAMGFRTERLRAALTKMGGRFRPAGRRGTWIWCLPESPKSTEAILFQQQS